MATNGRATGTDPLEVPTVTVTGSDDVMPAPGCWPTGLWRESDQTGQRIEVDTPAFFAAWQQRAEELSRVVRASGAKMYWVSPPPIERPPLSHAQRLFDGYRTIDGDHFLEAGSSLAGDDGEEIAQAVTCGHLRTIRTSDGTHLTADGARIYGQMIAHDLSADLGVLTTPRPC